jgi:hypothetical protein
MAANQGTTTATPLHTVVGIFSTDRRAIEAVHSLDAAGFAASRVQMVGDDPSRAAEVGGKTYAPHGFILGALAGVGVVFVFSAMGDLGRDPVGLAIGAVGVVGGLAVIGLVIGRTIGRHAPDAHEFAEAVEHGGAVVSVQCEGEECDRAVRVLDGAGAAAVREEPGPEAI